jgi:hypothetical protein
MTALEWGGELKFTVKSAMITTSPHNYVSWLLITADLSTI